ncbi:uncharacterized protein [Venturia canescens]|uniref:uncharacterized protein n=1 Tax=Venturia canescens TaxID=32260 RepID=UPI001C9CA475|nr:uncharacterized protein LOC122413406 [Venturia canescens]
MNVTVRFFLVLTLAAAAVSSAGILETLLSWDLPEAEERSAAPQSKCLCQSSGCLCCVDFNLTSAISLGGPACINIKQKEQNVSLNVSYGENPVHNATIKIENAANKPTCMSLLPSGDGLFVNLVQLCAKFTSISRSDQGHNGCLVIEPTLVSTIQATYNVGCFNFNQGVRQIEIATVPEATDSPAAEEDEEEEVGLNTEELIAAVSASAEKGIALFSQWLGLNIGPKANVTATKEQAGGQSSRTEEETSVENGTSRMSRGMSTNDAQRERSEERFRQLLSAQDNIMKESARIGQPYETQTKFVYSTPLSESPSNKSKDSARTLDENAAKSSIIVPRESRRGGRAYNIHQHVNEV